MKRDFLPGSVLVYPRTDTKHRVDGLSWGVCNLPSGGLHFRDYRRSLDD